MASLISKYKLSLLFLVAFLIRLINLDQSLWLDEATTAVAVQTHSFWNIVTQFSPSDFHPPLYYLVMKIWTGIFGYSEVALRMPSILFSVATGYIIYLIAKGSFDFAQDEKDRNLAFWSAAFFLFNPLIIYYSQEARMYAMVTFFVAASFYFLMKVRNYELRVRNRKEILSILLMNVFLILSFYTFYASIFYIATVFLFLLYKRKFLISNFSFLIFLLAVGMIAPLLSMQLQNSKIALQTVTNWSMVLGNVSLKNLFLFPIKFTSGRISFYPKMLYYALAGGWLGLVSLPLIKLRLRTSEVSKKYYFFLVMPLILGTLFSFNSPLLQYFRFQYLIIFLSILLALAVCSFDTLFAHAVTLKGPTALIRKKMYSLTLARMIGIFILIGFVSWSLLYLLNPQFHREDWKSLASLLKNENTPIYMILSSSDPLRYYAPELDLYDLKTLNSRGLTKDFIVIPYTADIHGINYSIILQDNYVKSDVVVVREVMYEKWKLQKNYGSRFRTTRNVFDNFWFK